VCANAASCRAVSHFVVKTSPVFGWKASRDSTVLQCSRGLAEVGFVAATVRVLITTKSAGNAPSQYGDLEAKFSEAPKLAAAASRTAYTSASDSKAPFDGWHRSMPMPLMLALEESIKGVTWL
jgi:hypothetical protein